MEPLFTPWNNELDIVLRLITVAILSGLIGYERGRREKPAGPRTHLLVGVGAATFTIVSLYGFGSTEAVDLSRVAAGVVVGMGFLGAGTILHSELGVRGLTTAATLWSVAAIGLAAGTGLYILAIVTAAIVMIALRLLRRSIDN